MAPPVRSRATAADTNAAVAIGGALAAGRESSPPGRLRRRLAVAFAGRHCARTVASSSFLSPPWHMSRQGRSEPKDQRLFATAGDKGDFMRESRRRWNLAQQSSRNAHRE